MWAVNSGSIPNRKYDVCINQDMKRNKAKKEDLRQLRDLRRKFSEHSPEYETCVDQIIENSV